MYTVAPWAWVVGGLGIATVYTNGRIGPLRAGLGRLCTLLGCCAVVDRCEDAIVYTDRRKRPLRTGLGRLCTLLGCCGQTWGRRSVHRSVKMASRRRFGAFVYTVATRVAIRICDASCVRRHERLSRHGVPAVPLAGPSRLVGKTGSERVAPLPGWHLRQGVNPREPLKSQLQHPMIESRVL